MPGIPEPGLFRCARLPLPPHSCLRPARHGAGGGTVGQRDWDLLVGPRFPHGRPPAPSTAPQPMAPLCVSRICSHPSLEASAPTPQSFILVAGDGQGVKPPSSSRAFKVKVLVAQSLTTICDPVDCSQPGSSVHGISQARIMEWGAIPSPGHLPDPGIKFESPAF